MKLPIPLPVDGPLDTANPATNRPAGVLVEGTDLAHRWIGPCRGLTQQTWAYQGAANRFMNPRVPVFDGTNSQITGTLRSPLQYNLPPVWSLDVVFRPSGVSHSGDTTLSIFKWVVNSITVIDLVILGGGSPAQDQRKIRATVTGITSGGAAGTTAIVDGTSQLSVGTSLTNVHHVRLQRNGTVDLYVNGVLEDQDTFSPTTEAHTLYQPAVTTTGTVTLAAGTTAGNHLYAGRIHSSVLRSGVWGDVTKGLRDNSFVKTPAVHFATLGRGGATTLTQARDQSLFDTALTESSLTSEDLSEPAPWVLPAVQGASSFTDYFGTPWNVVYAGGVMYCDQVN